MYTSLDWKIKKIKTKAQCLVQKEENQKILHANERRKKRIQMEINCGRW